MSMYARNNLLAFVLWNALLNGATARVKRSMASYWMATVERYAALVQKFQGLGSDLNGSSDVPMRLPSFGLSNALIGDLFGIAIVVLFIANLIGPVANFTTGITIPHTGFTPNPNVTNSVGLVPLVQLIPFVFVAVLIFGIFSILERHVPHGL